MTEVLSALFPYVAAIVTAALLGYVAIMRERYKADRDDKEADGTAVQAARQDERDQCSQRIAELREDIARLSGRIDEQGAELTEMRGRSDVADRRALIAEGRAMAMRSIAETAGADREMVRLIWERHDPAALQGRMPT